MDVTRMEVVEALRCTCSVGKQCKGAECKFYKYPTEEELKSLEEFMGITLGGEQWAGCDPDVIARLAADMLEQDELKEDDGK